MKRRPFLLSLSALACTPLGAQTATPIRIVVPYPPGGPLDIAARALAEAVQPALGRVIVENKAGAGGNIGADLVARAPADGHTLLLGAVATHAINPSLFQKLPYDPQKDFAPITLIAEVPNVLVVNAEYAARHGITDLRGLVVHLKGQPGRLSFASGGNGSAGHLAGELFKMKTGTFAVHIPYRGAAPAQLGLMTGETQFMFDNLASAAPRIREGRLRAFGVTTLKRTPAFPEIPTLAEGGLPALADFDISTWFGLYAPAATPKAIIDRYVQAFHGGLRSRAFADAMRPLAAEPHPTSPAELAALAERDRRKYAEIVRYSKATVD